MAASSMSTLLGDPAQPGLYIRLAKWLPHHFSKPHFHDKIRYFYDRVRHLVGEFQHQL